MEKLLDLLTENYGFATVSGSDRAVSRTWIEMVDVAFYGQKESSFSVDVELNNIGDSVRVVFSRNGMPFKNKIYSFGPYRALNAIRSTVEYNGFSLEAA